MISAVNGSRAVALFILLGWLALGALGAFAIARVAGDYVTSVRSLQDFRWRILRFAPPAPDAAETVVVLEIQNGSQLDLTLINPELFLWYGIDSIGKTYGYNERHTIVSGSQAEIPFKLVINSAVYEKARARTSPPEGAWRLTGTYKITTPLTDFDLLYRLALDLPVP